MDKKLKNTPRVLFLTGSWSEHAENAVPSRIMQKLAGEILTSKPPKISFRRFDLVNGGDLLFLLRQNLDDYDIVFWLPDANENTEAPICEIKMQYPNIILVASVDNRNKRYSEKELISISRKLNADIVIEMSEMEYDASYTNFRLYDSMGFISYRSNNISWLANQIMALLNQYLSANKTKMYRLPDGKYSNINVNICGKIDDLPEYLDSIKEIAGTANIKSCSARFENDATSAFMSDSDTDMSMIDASDLKYVTREHRKDGKNICRYTGSKLPAPDCPVHLSLYEEFPNIRFITHSHDYAETSDITVHTFSSCEFTNIIDDILRKIKKNSRAETSYIINLKGHGSIIMSSSPCAIKEVAFKPINN